MNVMRLLETAIFERSVSVSGFDRQQIRYNLIVFPPGTFALRV